MERNSKTIIKQFFEKYNIVYTDNDVQKFEKLTEMLTEFNSHTNVTAIKDPYDIAVKHYIDSMYGLCGNLIEKGSNIIDIGCGAGFPGLPIAIMRNDVNVTFVDSTEKKLRFTRQVSDAFGLCAQVIPARAEELAFDEKYREKFDVAVSRAVAGLPILCELVLPFVKPGGKFIAYKRKQAGNTDDPQSEIFEARFAIEKLGGKLKQVKASPIDEYYGGTGDTEDHCLIIIEKIKNLSTNYPRRYAQILKKPL